MAEDKSSFFLVMTFRVNGSKNSFFFFVGGVEMVQSRDAAGLGSSSKARVKYKACIAGATSA